MQLQGSKKAFFLDRDGVINIDHGYVYKAENFEFAPGVFTACKGILARGYRIVVVTNQAGIARGYYSEQDFKVLTQWMCEQFNAHDIAIADVRYCPHHPTEGIGSYLADCNCRKPKPGMIQAAALAGDIDLASSVLVGDKMSDIQAGQAAGIGDLYLVDSLYHSNASGKGYTQCRSLEDAVEHYFAAE